MKHLGWILDLYPRPGQMVVWLRKLDGNCVRLVDIWQPRFYVSGNQEELLEASSTYLDNSCFVEKFDRPGALRKKRVLEVKARNERQATVLAEQVLQKNPRLRLYNVDIPASQMYLYEKDLFPFAFVEAETSENKVRWTLRDSRETLFYEAAPFRKMSLRVKTRRNGKVRSFNDELDSIIVSFDNSDPFTINMKDETEKILTLVKLVEHEDPDIILTEDGDSFIFPYLSQRAYELGISDNLILGREQSPLKTFEVKAHSYFSYGKILYRENAARLHGRLHIDENNAFVVKDCGLEGLIEVSRTCIVPVQKASRATIGTNMTSLQFYNAVKQDVLIPWNKNRSEDARNGDELADADRGGFVYEPKAEIHDDVGELDFSSLYPTSMLKENLSGETVECHCCGSSTAIVPELGYSVCQRWQGIVPRSLSILLWKRALFKNAKKECLDPPFRERVEHCSGALKWILVCS